MIKFNQHGFISPSREMEISIQDVIDFSKNISSEKRDHLNHNLEVLVARLVESVSEPCQIWIYGSFVTNKKEPNDIDIRIFMHEIDYDNLYPSLFEIIKKQDELSFDLNVHPYNLVNLNEDEVVLVNGYRSLATNARINDELIEDATGFFQISIEA